MNTSDYPMRIPDWSRREQAGDSIGHSLAADIARRRRFAHMMLPRALHTTHPSGFTLF
jgi:hypothetical protein